MELRAQAAAVYDSLPRKPSRLTTPSGSNVVSLGERLGIQTFACSLGGTKMIARVSLPEQLLQRATEAELHGFSQVCLYPCRPYSAPQVNHTSSCRWGMKQVALQVLGRSNLPHGLLVSKKSPCERQN